MRIAVALLACVAIGFVAGRLTTPEKKMTPRSEDRRVAAQPPPAEKRREPRPVEKPTAASDVDTPAIADEVKRRAEQIRAQHLKAAELAEQTARIQVERELAKERALREDAARGGTMALLRKLKQDWTPPWELLSTPDEYAKLFERKTSGGAVDGTRIERDTPLNDGDIIRFPGGVSHLEVRWLQRFQPFPKDIVLEGRGMDDTLLVLSNEIRIRSEVHSLTFRDLTIHCNDNYLEAMRDGPYTLRLERCRVIGFDMGAGGSNMLSGSEGAFYATDCRIESGFGRSPGSGTLFDVRGVFIARLERCTIVGPFRSIYESGAAHVFANCHFESMPERLRSQLERATEVRFVDCTFDYLPKDAPRRRKKRPVTEINPNWELARR